MPVSFNKRFCRFFRVLYRTCSFHSALVPFLWASLCPVLICSYGCLTLVTFLRDSCTRTSCWHLYRFFGLPGVYVITGSVVWRYWFLLISSSYLGLRCSVTRFNSDKIQAVRPLGVGGFTIRLYTRNLIVYWDVRSSCLRLGRIIGIWLYIGMSIYSVSCLMDIWLTDFLWFGYCFNSNPILITVCVSIRNNHWIKSSQ